MFAVRYAYLPNIRFLTGRETGASFVGESFNPRALGPAAESIRSLSGPVILVCCSSLLRFDKSGTLVARVGSFLSGKAVLLAASSAS